jgi:hypothetical protein
LFRLSDGRGTQALWQRREMLVGMLHGGGRECCWAVAEALRAADRSGDREHLGAVIVPLESESDRAVRAALYAALRPFCVIAGEPYVVVADRYGRLYAAVHAHDRDAVREARAWIDFIQEQCDECGVGVDWA